MCQYECESLARSLITFTSQCGLTGYNNFSHQFYVRELLGDGKWVVADGQHVSLDGRLGLCLESRQSLGRRGVDFDQRLLVLAQHRQPPDQTLTHLANRLPVNLMDGWGRTYSSMKTLRKDEDYIYTKLEHMKVLFT